MIEGSYETTPFQIIDGAYFLSDGTELVYDEAAGKLYTKDGEEVDPICREREIQVIDCMGEVLLSKEEGEMSVNGNELVYFSHGGSTLEVYRIGDKRIDRIPEEELEGKIYYFFPDIYKVHFDEWEFMGSDIVACYFSEGQLIREEVHFS